MIKSNSLTGMGLILKNSVRLLITGELVGSLPQEGTSQNPQPFLVKHHGIVSLSGFLG